MWWCVEGGILPLLLLLWFIRGVKVVVSFEGFFGLVLFHLFVDHVGDHCWLVGLEGQESGRKFSWL